ncbi:MAG: threonine--tRNA ligase [Candidatus Saccharimonadales bacterium]
MDDKQLYAMRHSLAHILATAIQKLYPEAKFGVGPVVENGFYYDIDLGNMMLSEDNFSKIEHEMKLIIKADQKFECIDSTLEDALQWAETHNQPYKTELLNDLKRTGTTLASDIDNEEFGLVTDKNSKVSKVTFYKNGDFVDLCRGPHVTSTGKVGAFKLLRISGAYWRGNDKNTQMQRIYGVGFKTPKELAVCMNMLEEAKKRDHRKLGQELDLFVISDLVGPGLPLFTPRGTVLRNELIRFSEEVQREGGYEAVWAPHITRTDLYKKSGHYDKYPERFNVSSIESSDEFMMKPMNCPHVTQIYASRPRSYRDLPLRYMETTTMYRDEKSGELHGLSRVRALTQDDSHAFCRLDQIEQEMQSIMEMVKRIYEVLDLPLSLCLSFRDNSDKYLGNKTTWLTAQGTITNIAELSGIPFNIVEGEAAFYGPKIDIMIKDALGRAWQCATIQLDFIQPERFELEYTAEDGSKQRPVMIHKAILGSIERFLSVYIEHTLGRFPLWLAPEQLRIITVNQEDETIQFAEDIQQKARLLGIRATMDNLNETVGKKIRAAEIMKVPYSVVIGEKEIQSNTVLPRIRKDIVVQENSKHIGIDELLGTLMNETKSRVTRTSF